MNSVHISEPAEDSVTLNLSWDEAEVLTRIIGMVNAGNLETVSSTLAEFTEQMIEKVGRNMQSEARKYYAYAQNSVVGPQVYVDLASNW